MKVSLSWLKELAEYKLSPQELADLLSLKTIGVKQVTEDFLELDLTYNRGDLLSLRGVAREVSAITNSKIKFDDPDPLKSDLPETKVNVEDSKLCPFYCIAKIEGLKVDKSDEDWVKKLSDSGIRSINNVADVTNLIMLEYGQPMHAFDARGVKDESIIVRTAKKGDRITTLDGKTRDLDPSDLLITDSLNTLGIAGVMGGKDSEISDTTSTILLEAAIFDPVAIRNTSKRQGLYSEASKRFQHGLTKTNLLQALSAAIKMYEQLGGKLVALTIAGDLEEKPKNINLSHNNLNTLLGVDISEEHIQSSLKSLGFKLQKNGGGWDVEIPYWRLDCNIEEDLIEEVARIYGYEKIPDIALEGNNPEKLDQKVYQFIQDVKEACKEIGLTEISTYSFYSSDVLNNMDIDKKILLKVANPISSETEYLRFTLWENLVEVAAKNIKNGFKDIAIFEVGKTYRPDPNSKDGELPNEDYELSICLINGSDNPVAELNEILQKVMKKLDREVKITQTEGHPIEKKLFHPKRNKHIAFKHEPIGGMVEVHPRIVNNFGIQQRVGVAELSLKNLYGN